MALDLASAGARTWLQVSAAKRAGTPLVASTYRFKYASVSRGSAEDTAGSPARRRPQAEEDTGRSPSRARAQAWRSFFVAPRTSLGDFVIFATNRQE
jgi:hypothetical protein